MGGVLSDVDASDDVKLQIDPSPTLNPFKQKIDAVMISVTDLTSPDSLTLRLEASIIGGPSGDVIQEISLLNKATGRWDIVDTRPASTADTVIDAAAGGNLANYVNQITGEVIAKVKFSSPSFSGDTFTWSADIDHAVLLIE